VSIPGLAARNLLRNKLRSFLTVSGVTVGVLAFVLLRTVIWAWTAQSEDTAVDRIVTRHKVTFVMELPMSHFDEIRSMKEVRCATYQNWFGGKDPSHDQEFFATIACDEKTLFDVYDDMETPPDQKKAFLEDKQGALVGEKLMQRLGWKLGQTVVLQSQIYPGDWEFHIVGVYKALRKAVDPAQVFFHWDMLNERRPARIKDHIGWIVSRVAPGASAARTSLAIDEHFDALDVQTLSQDEHAFQQSFLAMFSAVLTALDTVSLVILGIMMLILGNTLAMGVRERTGEYAVLRAIGFLPRHMVALVVAEAAALGFVGGAVGLAVAFPLINLGMGRYIEENFGGMFPFFRVTPSAAIVAMALSIALAVVASVPPALAAYRLRVVDALRRVA